MERRLKTQEIGITEIAAILDCSRNTAWVRIRSGEIPGARLVAGRIWVAERRDVMKVARGLSRSSSPRRS